MPARRCNSVFYVSQVAIAPELAGNFIALSAVLKELAGKSPVAVALEPRSETVFVAHFPQPAYVLIAYKVGYQAAHVPQEAVGEVLRVYNNAVKRGQVRHRVVTVAFLECGNHFVGPVLATRFVTVFNYDFERLSVFGRNALKYLAKIGIEMITHVFLTHLVDLKSCSFG